VLAPGDGVHTLGRIAPIVHTYRSGEEELFVNSYLEEADHGMVAIDAPLSLSNGSVFRARFEMLAKPSLKGTRSISPAPEVLGV
jgi:hypothetical protein